MKKRHILFIFFDQLRYDAIGAMGNPYIQTPALDALANESVVFDRCFTPSPVCVPARLSMLAGQYPARTGNSNNNPKLQYEGKGFYSAITESGYDSCCVGKMHHIWNLLGDIGFKKRCTQEPLSNCDYYKFLQNSPYSNVFDYNGQRSEMYYVPQVCQLPAEYHPTNWIGDRSLDYLDGCDPENENCFLVSSIFHPHPPFSPPAPWNKLYRDYNGIPPYDPEGVDYDEIAPLLYDKFSTKRLGISELDLLRIRNFYYACVSFADLQVARIIAKLKEKGMYDDTLIVVSSDHGEMLGDFRSVGKRSMYDGAAHIPFFIRVPGMAHEIRHDVCSLVDLAPTLLSWAGVDYDRSEYDGIDLFSGERHSEVYSQYNSGKAGVYMLATDTEKLIKSNKAEKYYYYTDRSDAVDRFDTANPRVIELKEKLDRYIASDRCEPSADNPAVPGKGSPFGVKWKDDPYSYERELARIPSPYRITLTQPKKVKKSDFLE